MAIGTTPIILLIIVVGIWVFVEVKRFKHKIFAVFLIILILFTYISFAATIKGKDINFKSVEGLKEAGQLYFSWIGSVFVNIKTITSNAIHLDWSAKKTIEERPKTNRTK
jgi:hypothetical protein